MNIRVIERSEHCKPRTVETHTLPLRISTWVSAFDGPHDVYMTLIAHVVLDAGRLVTLARI